ncbi:MAG: XTP/dITP diphosphatase [Eubacteriales bacterium]|nr:XTP/dITP diphosphatase [Eubacteriales bacterium]
MKILIATANKNKVREFSEILSAYSKEFSNIDFISLKDIDFSKDIDENSDTFEGNALIKARTGASLGYLCIADDSGLSVDYLDGAPGVYSARYAKEGHNDTANNEKLLSELKGVPSAERSAKFVCAIAAVSPFGDEFTVRGECHGIIADRVIGSSGFGYDPLFLVPEYSKTFGQLSHDEKNAISHRGNAIKLLCEKLPDFITEYNKKLMNETTESSV